MLGNLMSRLQIVKNIPDFSKAQFVVPLNRYGLPILKSLSKNYVSITACGKKKDKLVQILSNGLSVILSAVRLCNHLASHLLKFFQAYLIVSFCHHQC